MAAPFYAQTLLRYCAAYRGVMRGPMSRFKFVILILLVASATASAQPTIDIFDKEISLNADCKIIARPSALDSGVTIQCDEGRIRILSYERNEAGLAEVDHSRVELFQKAIIGKLERTLVRYPEIKTYVAAHICDKEICIQFYGRTSVVNGFLALISQELVIQ